MLHSVFGFYHFILFCRHILYCCISFCLFRILVFRLVGALVVDGRGGHPSITWTCLPMDPSKWSMCPPGVPSRWLNGSRDRTSFSMPPISLKSKLTENSFWNLTARKWRYKRLFSYNLSDSLITKPGFLKYQEWYNISLKFDVAVSVIDYFS